MQLKVFIHLESPLTLPLSYHHILQAIMYKLMGDSNGNSALHNGGETFGKRKYKLFNFSLLEGKYKIKNKRISFFDLVSFEVRSIDENIIKNIGDNIVNNGIEFGDTLYKNVECFIKDEHITKDSILISMLSPICVYKTMIDSNFTNYLNPNSPDFSTEINNNFIRKYSAAEKALLPETSEKDAVSIAPVLISQKDKYITSYKNTIIEAYRGVYILSGKAEYLDFLFNVGLGSKNSQGFGMFNIVTND